MSPSVKPVKSVKSAIEYQNGLRWAAFLSATASLVGAWASSILEPSILLYLVLLFTSMWAVICYLSAYMVNGEILKISLSTVVFLLLAILSPAPAPLLLGPILGLLLYLVLLSYVSNKPELELVGGKRFYLFKHPLCRIIPLAYLAPKPLSPLFEPLVTFHWKPGAFNIPILQISVFEPLSIHDYIRSKAIGLNSNTSTWYDAMCSFRHAVGLLNLLDTVQKFEQVDLDGVALAASARLALSQIPGNTRIILREVLNTFKPEKRRHILGAYDLARSHA